MSVPSGIILLAEACSMDLRVTSGLDKVQAGMHPVVDHLLPMYQDTNDSHAAVDTFLEDWANENGGLRWAVTPVLIQHVGGKSTHGVGDQERGRLNDDMPCDYTFETNDPVQLALQHEAAVREMTDGLWAATNPLLF